jgi:hypothetical protein
MITTTVAQHLNKGKKDRPGRGETERERERVCARVGRHRDSVGRQPQTTQRRERDREHIETHMESIFNINNCGGLFD